MRTSHMLLPALLSGVMLRAQAQVPSATFTALPDFSIPAIDCKANAVSSDGSIVVGYGTKAGVRTACYWKSGVIYDLGAGPDGQAFGVSALGRVIVGTSTYKGKPEPFRWAAATGSHFLPLPSGYDRGAARGITDNGKAIVGYVFNSQANSVRAVLWDGTGVHVLHPSSELESRAWCISGDGSIVGGSITNSNGKVKPCVLTGTGFIPLPLQSSTYEGEVRGVSNSGKQLVGYEIVPPQPNGTTQVDSEWYIPQFLNGYVQRVSNVDNATGNNDRVALASNGTAIVGFGNGHNGTLTDAFLFNPNYSVDMHTLAPIGSRSFEQDFVGIPNDWQTLSATGLSKDGQTIVGLALNPQGQRQAFVITTKWFLSWDINLAAKEIEFNWGNDGSDENQWITVVNTRPDLATVPSPIPLNRKVMDTYSPGTTTANRSWSFSLTGEFTADAATVAFSGTYSNTTRTASFIVPASVWGINFDKTSVVGGATLIGSVSTTAKRSHDLMVTMSTDKPSLATVVPSTLYIRAGTGAGSAPFNVHTAGTSTTQDVTVTATIDGVEKTRTFTLVAASMASVMVKPSPVTGGVTTNFYVFLDGKAPAGGLTFTLASSNTGVARMPAQLVIPEGKTYGVAPVYTSAVSSNTLVTLGATDSSGRTLTTDLNVTSG